MSHGAHAVQHEVQHRLEHEHGGGGGHEKSITLDSRNKKVALVIAIMALFLAFSETLGKSAQTNAISYNGGGLQPVGFLSGQERPSDHRAHGCRGDDGRAAGCQQRRGQGVDEQADRYLAEDRRTLPLGARRT